MIKLSNICKTFGQNQILSNISLELSRQQLCVILGPSGSGKSTLLRCINFLEQPSSGQVHIFEKLISSPLDSALQKIGFVFQNFNLFPHMNVVENITYAAKIAKLASEQEINFKANALLGQFLLTSKAIARPKELSGGQKQRVAIARALILDPEFILFDEPTSALDQENKFELIKNLQKIKSNMGIVIVTHDIKFAKALADRIIFIDKGQVLCDQPAVDFFKSPSSLRAQLFMEQENIVTI